MNRLCFGFMVLLVGCTAISGVAQAGYDDRICPFLIQQGAESGDLTKWWLTRSREIRESTAEFETFSANLQSLGQAGYSPLQARCLLGHCYEHNCGNAALLLRQVVLGHGAEDLDTLGVRTGNSIGALRTALGEDHPKGVIFQVLIASNRQLIESEWGTTVTVIVPADALKNPRLPVFLYHGYDNTYSLTSHWLDARNSRRTLSLAQLMDFLTMLNAPKGQTAPSQWAKSLFKAYGFISFPVIPGRGQTGRSIGELADLVNVLLADEAKPIPPNSMSYFFQEKPGRRGQWFISDAKPGDVAFPIVWHLFEYDDAACVQRIESLTADYNTHRALLEPLIRASCDHVCERDRFLQRIDRERPARFQIFIRSESTIPRKPPNKPMNTLVIEVSSETTVEFIIEQIRARVGVPVNVKLRLSKGKKVLADLTQTMGQIPVVKEDTLSLKFAR